MMPPLELAAHLLGMAKWRRRERRLEQLMPSMLFDNQARLGDLGITLENITEAQRQSRSRGR